MPYTAQFFAEKLNVAVEYFNPFRNVQIDPGVNLEELAKVAHAFGEVVGLGLRNPTQCPVELNLMPKSILKRQQFNQKKPYFVAAVFSLILVVLAMGWFFSKVASVKQAAIEQRQPKVEEFKAMETRLNDALAKKKKTQEVAEQYSEWMQARFAWADLLSEVRRSLVAAEKTTGQPGRRSGVWVEKMAADNAEIPESQQEEEEAPRPMMMDIRMMIRYGLLKGVKLAPDSGSESGADTTAATTPTPAKTSPASTNEITVVNLTCRGVSWNQWNPTADSELAYALLKELQASSLFVTGTNGTQLSGSMQQNEENGTFSFDVKLKLKKPIKL
jgi:hypothetical protein